MRLTPSHTRDEAPPSIQPVCLRDAAAEADVNKHAQASPSKGPSRCCGQRRLPRVTLDDMADNALAVLMYAGAFRDLFRGCGEGRRWFRPHNQVSIDQSHVSKQFVDARSEDFFSSTLFFPLTTDTPEGEQSASGRFTDSFHCNSFALRS